jgi:hypothetical protein
MDRCGGLLDTGSWIKIRFKVQRFRVQGLSISDCGLKVITI